MIYTLDKLRQYVKDLDFRCSDPKDPMSNSWLDDRIQEGLAIAQDTKAIFFTKETYDTESTITVDKLSEVEIIPAKEVHSIYGIDCDLTYFDVTVTINNHVILAVKPNVPKPSDYKVTIRYMYYPTLPFVTIEMTMEMYKFVKRGIAISVFQALSDEQNEKIHQDAIDKLVLHSTFDIEKELMNVPKDRLWRGSWV